MTAYPFLMKNIEALQKGGHAIYEWLSAYDFAKYEKALEKSLFTNKWGLLDWRLADGKGMFEKMPPQPLYQDWIPKEKADTGASIVVGCNVGYGLNHLLSNTPDSHKIILIEPNREVLLACLSQTDYRPFLEIKKLHFAPPNEEYIANVIKHLDLQFIFGSLFLRGDMASQQIGPEYAQWTIRTKNRIENFSVEMTTLRYRQDVMVGNELGNFQRALNDGSLTPLKGRGDKLAAVVLGAGPSLAKYGPMLAENQGYALYTSALQTLPALKEVGIKPHFCLAIDYDDSMLRIYDRLDMEWARDIPLIYSTKLNPEVVKRYPGPTHPLWTQGGMATFTMQNSELVLDAGGNVSLALIRFLDWCGVKNILLAGQDFAWSGQASHASGHHASHVKRKFNPARHQKIKNLDGEEIITTVQYMTAKRELESHIRQSGLRVCNLYGGGAPIEETTPVDLKTVLMKGLLSSEPGSLDNFLNALNQSRKARTALFFEPKSNQWSTSLRNAEKRMEKLFKKHTKNQDAIHDHLEKVCIFIKQEPMYLPYLFNETISMSGLARARQKYHPKDFSEFRQIVKTVKKKVREVDRCVSSAAQAMAS